MQRLQPNEDFDEMGNGAAFGNMDGRSKEDVSRL